MMIIDDHGNDDNEEWWEPKNNDSSDIAKDTSPSQQWDCDPFQAELSQRNHLDEDIILDDEAGQDDGDDGDIGSVRRTVEDGQGQGRVSTVWLVGISK